MRTAPSGSSEIKQSGQKIFNFAILAAHRPLLLDRSHLKQLFVELQPPSLEEMEIDPGAVYAVLEQPALLDALMHVLFISGGGYNVRAHLGGIFVCKGLHGERPFVPGLQFIRSATLHGRRIYSDYNFKIMQVAAWSILLFDYLLIPFSWRPDHFSLLQESSEATGMLTKMVPRLDPLPRQDEV